MHNLLHTIRRVLALTLFVSLASLVSAAPTSAVLTFTSAGISGTFGIKLDPLDQSLVEITSVSLIIDGYKFKNKDLVFAYDPILDENSIGGVVNGLGSVNGSSGPDFLFHWSPAHVGGILTYVAPDHVTVVQTPADLTITQKKGSGK